MRPSIVVPHGQGEMTVRASAALRAVTIALAIAAAVGLASTLVLAPGGPVTIWVVAVLPPASGSRSSVTRLRSTRAWSFCSPQQAWLPQVGRFGYLQLAESLLDSIGTMSGTLRFDGSW
jgi:hypothetical protein